jgi:glutamine synthetase
METEIAKAQNELRCAYKDVEKASKRIAFTLSAVHNLKERLDKDIQE